MHTDKQGNLFEYTSGHVGTALDSTIIIVTKQLFWPNAWASK